MKGREGHTERAHPPRETVARKSGQGGGKTSLKQKRGEGKKAEI